MDEFAATLDRDTAKIVATTFKNLQDNKAKLFWQQQPTQISLKICILQFTFISGSAKR
jgi:hypothetical protein